MRKTATVAHRARRCAFSRAASCASRSFRTASSASSLAALLLVATPVLGVLAAAYALRADGRLNFAIPFMRRPMAALATGAVTRSAAGAIVLVTLVHVVETEKFVRAWRDYEVAVRTLPTGELSDPMLGRPAFVASDQIRAGA